MERKQFEVTLERNPRISIKVIPGHFTNSNAHISHYLDVSGLKSNALIAREAARELAAPYLTDVPIDTIVCMENTKVIGAYLAEELSQHGFISGGGEIYVITPMSNINGKLTFYDSETEWIRGKNILLLVATVSSGRTVRGALECLEYYGGKLAGISALFLASGDRPNQKFHALFTSEDVPGYQVCNISVCEMCKAGRPLDAIVSSEGYTKISKLEG